MKRIFIFSLFIFLVLISFSTQAQKASINWLSMEEAEKVYQATSKPFLVFCHTKDKISRKMESTTYSDSKIIDFINRFFIPVKIEDDLSLGSLKREGNNFYQYFYKSKNSSTSIFYPQENLQIYVDAYADVIRMQAYIIYTIEKAYLATDVDFFVEEFEKVFRPERGIDKLTEPPLYWTSFEELNQLYEEAPKKILVYLGAQWSNTSKMAERNIFSSSEFKQLTQEHFYCLHVDVNSLDTINFLQYRFINGGEENNNFHQFALFLGDYTIKVPSIYLLDETGRILEQLFFYQDKNKIASKLEYWGKNIYHEMSQEEYIGIKEKESF